jgi:nucleotide-binding universal stress UspA family protein
MERKIIIGLEPEHGGTDALRLGRLLAEVLAASPLVATVIPWPSYLMGPADMQRQVDLEMKDRFTAIREQLADLGGETRALGNPSPAHALNELAEQEDAEAIVLASPHHGPIGRTLAGSVAESLLHGAPCAVAIAPRGYGELEHARLLRIAVAFDGSAEAWTALETGIGIAERTRGELTVIAVADDPHYGFATAVPLLATGEFHDYEREDKQRLLELALGRTPTGLRSAGRLLSGDAGRLLTEVSGEFDLIVTGSRAYGPLRRTVLGSTTRKLIASSGCPVLVLPRGVGVDPLGLRVRPASTPAGA